MRIVVMGAGSMGCLVGGYLSRGGHDVMMLDVVPERVEAIKERGVTVEGSMGDFEVNPRADTTFSDKDPPELVIVCVKSYDSDRAARSISQFAGESTLVLTLQNGLGNIEKLAHHLPRERLLAGTTSLGANLLRAGHVHHAGEGDTYVGHLEGGPSEAAERVARVLDEARLPTTTTEDIRSLIWAKLAVNTGINALTAILQVRNGRLLTIEHAEAILQDAVRECVEVADASGIALDPEATLRRVKKVARLTASNRSSMLMDRLSGQRSEIEAINGAVVRRADELDIPVPVNKTLTRLVLALEAIGAE